MPQLLSVICEERYFPAKPEIRAKSTRESYRRCFRNLGEFLGRSPTLDDLTDETIGGLLCWYLERGLSPYTVNRRRSYLIAFWTWCAKKQLTSEWPNLGKIPEPQRTPRAWTISQLARLFTSCDCELGTSGGVPARYWWRAIHEVWWATGERTEATLAIRLCDLDLEDGTKYTKNSLN